MDQKDTYTRVFLEAAGQSADLDTVKQYRAAWWWNVRDKDKGGLRLSEQALNFINEYAKIKTYKIEFPKDFAITPQVLVWLDNFIDSPYYITKNILLLCENVQHLNYICFRGYS